MDISLSNYDIFNALSQKCNVMTYKELYIYKTIEDAMGKFKSLILLYETKSHYGHWICIFERINDKNKKVISFFDSYSLPVDDELNYISSEFKEENNTVYPYLSYLLYNSPLKIEYNEFPLQELGDHISTCGYWCIARILFKKLSPKQFNKLFRNGKTFTSDQLVVEFVKKYLK